MTLIATAFAAAGVADGGVGPIVAACSVPLALFALTGRHLSEHPFPRLGAANAITLVRAGLVGVLAAFVLADAISRTALVFAGGLAFALDGVDGWVARRTGTASAFGARLDMELDGLFVLVLGGLSARLAEVGPWVFTAGLARYAFLGAMAVWPFMNRPLPPTRRRPWACGIGVGLLVGSLAPVPLALAGACAALGVAAIVGSFAIDVGWLVVHREDGPW